MGVTNSVLKPFTVKNRNGEEFFVTCNRNIFDWELTVRTSAKEDAGFLRFAPQEKAPNTVKIYDFQINPKFWGKGIGTDLLNTLFVSFKEEGFNYIVGICKSSNRDLSEKEDLARWYEKLGFVLVRETSEEVPGYLGELSKEL